MELLNREEFFIVSSAVTCSRMNVSTGVSVFAEARCCRPVGYINLTVERENPCR